MFWGTDPRGLTLGIFGMGAIGQAVARRAAPFGMRVIYNKRSPTTELERELGATFVTFDELIATSDVLSVHVPLNDETVAASVATSCAACGAACSSSTLRADGRRRALIEALESGQVAGVELDVTANEPDVPAALREHPRALILPHIASATHGTRGAMMRTALENAAAVLEGRADERGWLYTRRRGSSASRSESPSKLKANTAMLSATPGAIASHGARSTNCTLAPRSMSPRRASARRRPAQKGQRRLRQHRPDRTP